MSTRSQICWSLQCSCISILCSASINCIGITWSEVFYVQCNLTIIFTITTYVFNTCNISSEFLVRFNYHCNCHCVTTIFSSLYWSFLFVVDSYLVRTYSNITKHSCIIALCTKCICIVIPIWCCGYRKVTCSITIVSDCRCSIYRWWCWSLWNYNCLLYLTSVSVCYNNIVSTNS